MWVLVSSYNSAVPPLLIARSTSGLEMEMIYFSPVLGVPRLLDILQHPQGATNHLQKSTVCNKMFLFQISRATTTERLQFHNIFCSFKLMRPRSASTLSTMHSTLSPIRGVILCNLLECISASRPTPMSTKQPKCVTFVMAPVTTVSTTKSDIFVRPCLNNGFFSKSSL